MDPAFPSRWLSGSSCVTAWCIVPLLSVKLRSSIQHSDARSFLSAGMSPSGWSAQYTEAALDWLACGAGCPSFAILYPLLMLLANNSQYFVLGLCTVASFCCESQMDPDPKRGLSRSGHLGVAGEGCHSDCPAEQKDVQW